MEVGEVAEAHAAERAKYIWKLLKIWGYVTKATFCPIIFVLLKKYMAEYVIAGKYMLHTLKACSGAGYRSS
jgi:hypothetical protein